MFFTSLGREIRNGNWQILHVGEAVISIANHGMLARETVKHELPSVESRHGLSRHLKRFAKPGADCPSITRGPDHWSGGISFLMS